MLVESLKTGVRGDEKFSYILCSTQLSMKVDLLMGTKYNMKYFHAQ